MVKKSNKTKIAGILKKERNIAVFIGLIALVLFAYLYLPVFSIGFLSDDFLDINQRFSIRTLNSFEMGGFRPLSVAVYSIDSSIYSPTNPWGWHLTNLILHAGNVILMWFLLKELSFRGISRVLAVSFFVLAAAGSPAVARMSGRTTIIAILPLIGAFLCHAKWCTLKRNIYLYTGLILVLFSLLAKEIALTSPLIFAVIGFYQRKGRIKKSVNDFSLYIIPVVIYLIWRISVFGFITAYRESQEIGFFMVRNLFLLASRIWTPWMDGLSIRLLFLSLVVFLFIMPLKRRLIVLYMFMTAALLATVTNLPPAGFYLYSALPAASILIAGVVSDIKHKYSVPIVALLIVGSFLSARDEVSIIGGASKYTEGVLDRIVAFDSQNSGSEPVFLSGIRFDYAGYGTLWRGAYREALTTRDCSIDRTVSDADGFWEILLPEFERDSMITAYFLNIKSEEVITFLPSSREWDNKLQPFNTDAVTNHLWVTDSLHLYNSCVIWPADNRIKLTFNSSFVSGDSLVILEPHSIKNDSAFFDLEGSYEWVLRETPFELNVYNPTFPETEVVFNSQRIWLEELESRLEQKDMHLSSQ